MSMDKELKAKWIADLRDPVNQNKQGTGSLHDIENGKYCCLGRLCVVAGIEPKLVDAITLYDGYATFLSDRLLDKFGMADDAQDKCILMNDRDGFTFAQIADALEADDTI